MAEMHRKNFDPSAKGAMEGVRIIDLSRLVAGNILTKVFADHGAEVIKVEPPEGDTLRAWRVGGVETSWKTICRNKKSICLDLKNAEGIAAVRALAGSAATACWKPWGLIPKACLPPIRALSSRAFPAGGRMGRIGTSRALALWWKAIPALLPSMVLKIANPCCRPCSWVMPMPGFMARRRP
jgi:hypothetical protein